MWKAAIISAVLGLVQVSTSNAATVTYTFDGTGAVTLNGTSLGTTFSVVFTGDTAAVDLSGCPFCRNNNLIGTFTDGSVVETITATVESNSSLANIDFYDATFTNGLGFQDNALAGYQLITSIGPITASPANLTPTFGGGTFSTGDGGTLQFTESDSLSFAANVSSTPLPPTWTMMLAGLAGFGFLAAYRGRKNEFSALAAA